MARSKHTSYFYAIFGIGLVLFVLGSAAALILELKKVSGSFKESLNIEVVLKDSLTAENVLALKQTLQQKPYIKQVRYISKDDAAKILKKDLGEDFLDILGYNPL
ncbi:MAG TPA: permease-like cell division protein FtsX, partial [Chitinophagales bacterium]|nr:permease-like cell division protein FtsX [Chitinophagales bacterium]